MTELAAQQTRRWIEQFVVGLALCPFAEPVLRANTLRIAVSDARTEADLAAATLTELDLLQSAPESELVTSVLVFSAALGDFDDYLDFLGLAEALLEEAGLEGVVQIASFHPNYCFAEVEPNDASHYSNRSPYPMLHFIREAALTRALENYPDPELIPERNIERLRKLGTPAALQLRERCLAPE